VCLSVSLSVKAWSHSSKPADTSLLLWVWLAGDINRLLQGARQRGVRQANAGSATLSA